MPQKPTTGAPGQGPSGRGKGQPLQNRMGYGPQSEAPFDEGPLGQGGQVPQRQPDVEPPKSPEPPGLAAEEP